MKETFFRYIPSSTLDEKWGFVVTNGGIEHILPDMEYPPHGHPKAYRFSYEQGRVLNEFQLHFIPEGKGTFENLDAGELIPINAGDFFLLFPGVRHRYKPVKEEGWKEYWIGFHGTVPEQLLGAGIIRPEHSVYKAQMERRALELFSELITYLRNEPPGFVPVISSITSLLLSMVSSVTQASGMDSREEKVIRRTRERLRGNLDENIDLQKLAEEFGVSYSWLRKNFKDSTGISIYQYRQKIRFGMAMDLLSNPNNSVKEVAVMTGFEDEHYFSRIFKSKTGLSPRAWRKRLFN